MSRVHFIPLLIPSTVMPCSNEEADILAHTSLTGRYVTGELRVLKMAQNGWLKDHGAQRLAGGDHYYTMTPRGREVLNAWKAAQPKPPPVSQRKQRARARWHRFQSAKELNPDLTFSLWLRTPHYH